MNQVGFKKGNEIIKTPGKRVRVNLLLIGIIALGLAIKSDEVQAASRNPGLELLETIGISVAVGAALGASTLSFYDRPAEHWSNILYGAAAGGAVGMGILVYGMFDGNDSALTNQLGPGQRLGGPRSVNLTKAPTVVVPLVSLRW